MLLWKYDNTLLKFWKKIRKHFFNQRKNSSITSSGHKDAFLIIMPKDDKKTKHKLNVSKNLFIGNFSETLSLDLTTLLKISAKSPFFPQNSEKLPPAPQSEKKIKLNFLHG